MPFLRTEIKQAFWNRETYPTSYSNILGGGNTAEEDGNEDLTQSELFEEKLRETIDLATQKSANGKLPKI